MKARFFIFFYFVSLLSYGQESQLHIAITNPAEKAFLDTVEQKLLAHIHLIQEKKIEQDMMFFNTTPIGINWGIILTKQEAVDNSMPKEYYYRATDTFDLSIRWNSNLDTGSILGFSKMYYHDSFYYNNIGSNRTIVNGGRFLWPVYAIPLKNYSQFLTPEELNRLNKIIEINFLRHISDSASILNDSVTMRYITDSMGDSLLPQFSMSTWTQRLNYEIHTRERRRLVCYSNPLVSVEYNKGQGDSLFSLINFIYDSTGQAIDIGGICDIYSICEYDSWRFFNNNDSKSLYSEYFIWKPVSLKFFTYSESTEYSKGDEKLGKKVYHYCHSGYLKYADLAKRPDLNEGKFSLYKEVLNSTLYKRLEIHYNRLPDWH